MKLSALFQMPEVTFATDPDSDGSDYKHIKAHPDMTFTPMQTVIDRPGLTNDLARQKHVMGAKGGTLNFKLEVKGSGTPAATGTPAIAPEADALLTAIMGTVTRGTGTTIASTSTTTVLECTSAAGLSVGMMITVNCGATYGYVSRFVSAIATNSVTVHRAFPAIPANGAAVHASNKYTRANTGHGSMAFVAIRGTIIYTLLGCKLAENGAKLSGFGPNGTAMLDLTFDVTDWNTTAKASLPATALTGITATVAPVIKGACFDIDGTEAFIYGFDFDFGLKFAFHDSTCAQGPGQPDSINAGLQLVESAPKGSVKAYYRAATMTDFSAGTERQLGVVSPGGSIGNQWGLYVPKVQLAQPAQEDHNGMVGEGFGFMVNDNGTLNEYYFCLA
jgi:hypothetical protein